MTDTIQNVISISGGKDSTATALLAIERETPNLHFVFADTGHEHPQTYDYVHYLDAELRRRCGVGIRRVRADFSAKMATRRRNIVRRWAPAGVPRWRIRQARRLLQPTGIPFLDLCILRGRFPSARARFCTQELKVFPIQEQVLKPLSEQYEAVVCWHGVRADESRARGAMEERDVEFGAWEPEPAGILLYRPILQWTAADVFDFHRKHDIRWNPLYEQGMGRVGCMPCIHARKDELLEIGRRFPEEIQRVAEWEKLVSEVSKRGTSTLFKADTIPGNSRENDEINRDTHGVEAVVQWAKTGRGGRQIDWERASDEVPVCSSIYGLCE